MLRRLIAIIMALVLLLCCVSALAEETAEKPAKETHILRAATEITIPGVTEETEEEDSGLWFRAMPGYTCFPLIADNPDTPGRFILDAPMEWDGGDYSGDGIPTVIALQDMQHVVMVDELGIQQQTYIDQNPGHPMEGFLEEGRIVTRQGKSTSISRIIETFDLHGLRATRVEMIGQGYEMIWIEDDEDLWFFMYPVNPTDSTYTNTIADMVDSFTVFHPASIGDAPAEDFEYVDDENGVTITKYIGAGAYVHIPAEINGKPVVKVGDEAFYETDVREVTFPDTVTEIGSFVFGGCTELITVTLPKHLQTLPSGTFESCFRLANAELNEELTRIEAGAFWGITSLYNLALPDSLIEIEEENFIMASILSNFIVSENSAGFSTNPEGTILFSKDGKRLLHYGKINSDSAYTVPDGVEQIDPYAFWGITQLTKITLPESLTTIGGLAFAMTSIKEITIPAGTTEIGIMRNVSVDGNDVDEIYSSIGNETTIYGAPGSAAEEYATQYNKTFIPVEENAPAE